MKEIMKPINFWISIFSYYYYYSSAHRIRHHHLNPYFFHQKKKYMAYPFPVPATTKLYKLNEMWISFSILPFHPHPIKIYNENLSTAANVLRPLMVDVHMHLTFTLAITSIEIANFIRVWMWHGFEVGVQ